MTEVKSDTGLNARDFTRVRTLIHREIGIQLPGEKRTMLEGRIRKRLGALSIWPFGAYCSYLFSEDGQREELLHLPDAVTINKTSSFREPMHFDFLAQTALP